MTTLCKPGIALPDFVVTQAEFIAGVTEHLKGHPQLNDFVEGIKNTGIDRRYCIRSYNQQKFMPIDNLKDQNDLYIVHATRLAGLAAREALENAGKKPSDIDLLIAVSCTGWMIPSFDAYLIDTMGFRQDVKRLPITNMACAGGATAVARACEFCKVYPQASVLIITVEISSLHLKRSSTSPEHAVASGIFGDGASACVVTGKKSMGFKIEASATYTLPNTQGLLGMPLTYEGFDVSLSLMVPYLIKNTVPFFQSFASKANADVSKLDFFVLHPGGRKVLDRMTADLKIPESKITACRQCLAEVGNISSASIFVVLKILFDRFTPKEGDRGLLSAFGPGFTTEVSIGKWVEG